MGKEQAPFATTGTRRTKTKEKTFLAVYLVFFTLYLFSTVKRSLWPSEVGIGRNESLCAQPSPLFPKVHGELWKELQDGFEKEEFQSKAVEWLAGAVKVPTEMFDDMGPVGEDPRWENRASFHEYLVKAFPLIHSSPLISIQKVNTYGLLYTWKGSDENLKPIIMAAHQDVVPVNPTTFESWTYPPYSGHFDGERIWGRGTNDDKSGLIGIFTAVETLLSQSFNLSRTIVFPFGFDEEGGGIQGAGELGKALLDIYGEDSFAFIIDEGGGFTEQFGTQFATPGIAEKGSLTVQLNIATPGGHSSVPPDHTSIGILSRLLVELENNPFDFALTRSSPLYAQLICFSAHAQTLPPSLRTNIRRSLSSDSALADLGKQVFSMSRLWKSMSGTTQAIDVIHGGVKSNALPEQAFALINHRIGIDSSSAVVEDRDTRLLLPLAEEFNLAFTAFGKSVFVPTGDEPAGKLDLEYLSTRRPLEPAPVTPLDSNAFGLLAGTIRSTFDTHRAVANRTFEDGNDGKQKEEIFVAPGMPTGNTDTRFYWKLSKNIFRYKHHHSASSAHTVDEFIELDSYLEMIRFYMTLILNSDEARDI
ncbi:hypothetical protein VKT23_010153 [Stygiomarasmius scandens]|uniref:Peptidase M20 dimerisation domain-containing protein n=1 Tax=Marasmiellus scandens TaxID=2682957 RepID=A0ABR1JEU9_9AGAR